MEDSFVASEFAAAANADSALTARITTGVNWINRELRDAATHRDRLRASQEVYFEEQVEIFNELVVEQHFLVADQVFKRLILLIVECPYLNWPTTDEFRTALVEFALFRVDAGA